MKTKKIATKKTYRITFRSEVFIEANSADEAEEKFGELSLFSDEAHKYCAEFVETNSIEEE